MELKFAFREVNVSEDGRFAWLKVQAFTPDEFRPEMAVTRIDLALPISIATLRGKSVPELERAAIAAAREAVNETVLARWLDDQ